jgi:hypothetical protein
MSKQVKIDGQWYDVTGGPLPSKCCPGNPWYVEYLRDAHVRAHYVRDSDLRDAPPVIEVPSEVWVNVYAIGSMYAYRTEAGAEAQASITPRITTRYILPLPWKKCGQGTPPPLAMKLFQLGDFYVTEADLLATLPKEEGK